MVNEATSQENLLDFRESGAETSLIMQATYLVMYVILLRGSLHEPFAQQGGHPPGRREAPCGRAGANQRRRSFSSSLAWCSAARVFGSEDSTLSSPKSWIMPL